MTTVSQEKLSKEQKEAVALLSVGTMLECFDVVLYMHMAVLLNDLFFPVSDSRIRAFIPAFSFLSTYFLRPFGALFFGYLGDTIGRKPTIILTTIVMSLCCITMAGLPTYEQIGITAPIVLTICRMLQGASGKAEEIGVQLYIAESVKPPIQYPLVSLVAIFVAIGSVISLCVGAICTNPKLFDQSWIKHSWRFAFLVGAVIGIVGAKARTSMQEATDFTDRQRMYNQKFKDIRFNSGEKAVLRANISPITSFYYFCLHCGRPPCIYFIYAYCPEVLKTKFGFSVHEVILSSFYFCFSIIFALTLIAYLSYRMNPLKIVKTRAILFFCIMPLFPLVMSKYPVPSVVILFQCLAGIFMLEDVPAGSIFFKNFPVLKRFKYAASLNALAEVTVNVITSLGLVWATLNFGYSGILIIFVPAGLLFIMALGYFEKKESQVSASLKF